VIAASVHGVEVLVDCDDERLLPWHEYLGDLAPHSLLNQFHRIQIASASHGAPALAIRQRDRKKPTVVIRSDLVTVEGDLLLLEKTCRDRRFTILGTVGVLFRTILRELERASVLTLHASALYDATRHEVVAILGASGAGKTPVMLAGLSQGYQLLGTDHVHLSLVNGCVALLKGGVRDNVYPGSLIGFAPLADVPAAIPVEAWFAAKQSVDLSKWQADVDAIVDPRIRFVAPSLSSVHERQRRVSRDMQELQSYLYDNATEKLAQRVPLYDGAVEMAPINDAALSTRRSELLRAWLAAARIQSFDEFRGPAAAAGKVFLP
jgi:hypothetical protein